MTTYISLVTTERLLSDGQRLPITDEKTLVNQIQRRFNQMTIRLNRRLN